MPRLINKLMGRLDREKPENIGPLLSCDGTVEIQAAKSGEEAVGPPTFESLAYTGSPMKLSGWRYPAIIDLNGFRAARQSMPALRDHEFTRVVGHTTEVAINASGVFVKGVISGSGNDANEVVTAARNGFPWQASHGTNPDKGAVEHLPAGRKAIVNNREIEGPMSIVRRASMFEFTFTPLGADTDTTAAIAASFSGDEDMAFQEWIKATGWNDASSLTDGQQKTLKAAFDAEQSGNEDPPAIKADHSSADIKAMIATATTDAVKSAVAETLKSVQADNDRKTSIIQACAGHADIQAKAVAESWSLEKAELAVERASRPKPIFASTGVDGAPEPKEVIQAALCVNAGMSGQELTKNFDEKVINAAMSSRLRGFGLHAMMYETIRAAGRSMAPGMANDSLIRTAFECDREIKASGVSTHTLTNTLADTVNRFIVAGIGSVDQSWRQISAVGSTKDFRTVNGVRLTGDMKYLELGPDGEIKHASMSDTPYTNRAKTYARMFALTRQDLINDDLGNLESSARNRLGRGSGTALNLAFWTEFMDNSTFFTAARGNYDEDTDTALAVAGLTLAEALFRNQTDEDGLPAEIEPAILLVPNTLATTAAVLMGAGNIQPEALSNVNPWAGRFRVVVSPYLSNTAITGYSATAWYLLADPNTLGVGVIQTVFLNGKQVPTVESSELDFNMLGIQWRGFWDFGVAKQEYRAGVQMAGVNV